MIHMLILSLGRPSRLYRTEGTLRLAAWVGELGALAGHRAAFLKWEECVGMDRVEDGKEAKNARLGLRVLFGASRPWGPAPGPMGSIGEWVEFGLGSGSDDIFKLWR